MEFQCIPTACTDKTHDHWMAKKAVRPFAHPVPAATCPLWGLNLPFALCSSVCCALNGSFVIPVLEETLDPFLGDAVKLGVPTCTEVLALAEKISEEAKWLRTELKKKDLDAKALAATTGSRKKPVPGAKHTRESIFYLEEAARWFQKVGELGFGTDGL